MAETQETPKDAALRRNCEKHETVEAAMADFLAWCDERKSKAVPFRVCACGKCPANKHNKVGCFVNWLFMKGTSDGRSDDGNAAHAEPSRARTDEGAADARHPCGHDGLRA